MNISITTPKSRDTLTIVFTGENNSLSNTEIAQALEYLAQEYKSQHIQRSNDESGIDPTQIADGNETISSE